jgi:hypothetical protein
MLIVRRVDGTLVVEVTDDARGVHGDSRGDPMRVVVADDQALTRPSPR